MKVSRILCTAALLGLTFGLSTAVAHADGAGTDPRTVVHSPSSPGTPGVGADFDLAPFGSTNALCSFSEGVEDCLVKNTSGFNWDDLNITVGSTGIGCDDVTLDTDLFVSRSCTQTANGGLFLDFSGVNYSAAANAFIGLANQLTGVCVPITNCNTGGAVQQTLLANNTNGGLSGFYYLCNPGANGGGTPGVLAGCDVEFTLGIGPDGGNWQPGTTFSVQAPEPSSILLLILGLGSVLFLGSFKKAQHEAL